MKQRQLRFKNDIPIAWPLKNKKGEPMSFEGKEIHVVMMNQFGGSREITDYIIEGNVLKWVFYGKDQEHTGEYFLTFSAFWKEDQKGMNTVNSTSFVLVDRSEQATDGDEGCCVMNPVELSGEIIVPSNGLNAYQLALQEGFKGTLQEWLASLKGEKGDRGLSGNINYPTFSVDENMHLIMHTDSASDADRFRLEKGHLILTL